MEKPLVCGWGYCTAVISPPPRNGLTEFFCGLFFFFFLTYSQGEMGRRNIRPPGSILFSLARATGMPSSHNSRIRIHVVPLPLHLIDVNLAN